MKAKIPPFGVHIPFLAMLLFAPVWFARKQWHPTTSKIGMNTRRFAGHLAFDLDFRFKNSRGAPPLATMLSHGFLKSGQKRLFRLA